MFKPSCGSTKILYQVFTSYVKIWDHVNLIQLNVRLKSFMFHSYLLSLNLKLLTLLQLRGGGLEWPWKNSQMFNTYFV